MQNFIISFRYKIPMTSHRTFASNLKRVLRLDRLFSSSTGRFFLSFARHLLPVSPNVIVPIVLRAPLFCYIDFLIRRDAQPAVLIALFRPDRETRKNSRERRFNERIFRLQCFGSSSDCSYAANMQSFSSVCR